MKRCRLKPSSSSHQTNTLQHKRTPRFKKNPISTFRSTLRGLFTSASSPSRMRTKTRFQQETIKKLFLVETPPRRRHALRCQKFTKSRRKLLSSSSIDSHTSTDVVSPKRTAYSMPAVAALWRSPAGQAPTINSTDDSILDFMQIDMVMPSTLCSEAGPDVDDFTEVAKRNPINPKDAITKTSKQLNRLVDLRREAYRDLALSTQTYNDALVLRMRHLESLSWEDQRSWVQSLGDSNSFGGMVGAEFCNWNGDLGNDGNVVVIRDDDVDELIDLMDGDAGNVKDYEELLEYERGIMKHDVDEANWVGDLW